MIICTKIIFHISNLLVGWFIILFLKFVLNIYFQSLESHMLSTREPLEWHFKQLDHAVGLSFRCIFKIQEN